VVVVVRGKKGSLPLVATTCMCLLLQFVLTLAENCGTYTATDGSRFDLSSLTTTLGYNTTVNSGFYAWNFCQPVPSFPDMAPCGPSGSSYAVLINGTGPTQKCYSIGDSSIKPTFSDGMNGPGAGVTISYKTSGGCLTAVRVNCNSQIDYVWKNVQPTNANCTYLITVQAKVGCKLKGSGPHSGLSGGSIFLIIFFVGLATYFMVGALIKWKLMGAPAGVDMIPNVEFWTSLPGLVADGCRFTKAKIMGLLGKSYEPI